MEGVEPVVVQVELGASREAAWEAFTTRFSEWWPAATHSLSRAPRSRCSLDARAGGALEERSPDGSRHAWGLVESVDAGRRIRFTWHPGREPESAQWVEVEFEPAGPGSLVTLTHGGWEALGEIAPILRREYLAGWQHVLGTVYAAFVTRN